MSYSPARQPLKTAAIISGKRVDEKKILTYPSRNREKIKRERKGKIGKHTSGCPGESNPSTPPPEWTPQTAKNSRIQQNRTNNSKKITY